MVGIEPMVALGQAQSPNGLLQGNELAPAATTAADLARSRRGSLIAGDGAGERFIGAAIALNPEGCKSADPIRCFDGQATRDHLRRGVSLETRSAQRLRSGVSRAVCNA